MDEAAEGRKVKNGVEEDVDEGSKKKQVRCKEEKTGNTKCV